MQLLTGSPAAISPAVGPAEPQRGSSHHGVGLLLRYQQEPLRTALDDVDEVPRREAAAPLQLLLQPLHLHGASAVTQAAGGLEDHRADGGGHPASTAGTDTDRHGQRL